MIIQTDLLKAVETSPGSNIFYVYDKEYGDDIKAVISAESQVWLHSIIDCANSYSVSLLRDLMVEIEKVKGL